MQSRIRFDLKTVDYLRGIKYLYFTLGALVIQTYVYENSEGLFMGAPMFNI